MRNKMVLLYLLLGLVGVGSAQETTMPKLFSQELNVFVNVRDFTISSDGEEVFFTIQSPNQAISQIASMKKKGDEWDSPQLLSFCDEFEYMEPFLTADGLMLFFASNRPQKDTTIAPNFDIWYVSRPNLKAPWSTPINVGAPINSQYDEFYPTLSRNKNLYFTLDAPTGLGKDDIYCAHWKDGRYEKPVLLSTAINSEGYEFNAFISANEDFLLFSKYNAKDGYGSGDIYIARKRKGEWQEAENLGGTINSIAMDYCPYYDEVNKELYFTSRRNELEPKTFENIQALQDYISKHPNGLSKIYKVKWDERGEW